MVDKHEHQTLAWSLFSKIIKSSGILWVDNSILFVCVASVEMADLEETLRSINNLIEINIETCTNPPKQTKVVMLLRKSKANNGRDTSLSLEAQKQLVATFLKTYYQKHSVVAIIESKESGMTQRRPDLFRALRICAKEGAVLAVAKVDRLARNIMLFMSLLQMKIPIAFAEYPTINFKSCTGGEKKAILRAAMEGYIEGMSISERTRSVMPLLKKGKTKMGGLCKGVHICRLRVIASGSNARPIPASSIIMRLAWLFVSTGT